NFNSGFDVYALDARAAPGTVLLRPDLATLPPAALWRLVTPGRPSNGLALPGRPARLAVTAAVRPPRGVHLGTLLVTLSVQDGWGIVYSVPAGSLPADGRHPRLAADLPRPRRAAPPAAGPPPPLPADLPGPGQPAAAQASGRGGARYPLRLLGLSLSYQLPGFPVPPVGPTPGIKPAEARIAAARATLDVRDLAVSARATGRLPAPLPRAPPPRAGRSRPRGPARAAAP